MIRNERERRVTQRNLTELIDAAEAESREPMPDRRDPEMHQLVIDGFHTQIAELQAELDDYAELAAGRVKVELPDLDELGDELVRARIAAGLSQRKLDEAAGLAEGVIRRYERERYNGASLHRFQLVQHTLQSAMMGATSIGVRANGV